MLRAFDALEDFSRRHDGMPINIGSDGGSGVGRMETYANRSEPDVRAYGFTVLRLSQFDRPDGAVEYSAQFSQQDRRAHVVNTETFGVRQEPEGELSMTIDEWVTFEDAEMPVVSHGAEGGEADAERLLDEIDRLYQQHDGPRDQSAIEQ